MPRRKPNPSPPNAATNAKEQRRLIIVRLLEEHTIRSQNALLDLLAEERVQINQATLSRDLRDLGVVKGPQGYALPGTASAGRHTMRRHDRADAAVGLRQAARQWLLNAIPVHNQLVLKTTPGAAGPVAVALDASDLPEAVGTIAGDDTVLVICADKVQAARLAQQLEGMRPSAAVS